MWPKSERAKLPEAAEPPRKRRRASDGSEYALRSRVVALDPLRQQAVLEMRAERWRDDERVAEETHTITINMYFTHELALILERTGFVDLAVYGDYTEEPASAETDFVVFVARRQA